MADIDHLYSISALSRLGITKLCNSDILKINFYLCLNPDRPTIEKIRLEYRFLLPVKEEYPREVRGRWLKNKTTPSFQKKLESHPS